MDIQKELKELIYDKKSVYDLRDEINQEKIKLEKQMHLILALSISEKMEKAVNQNLFRDFSFINYEIRFYSLKLSVKYSLKGKGNKKYKTNISQELTEFLDEIALDMDLLDAKYRNQDKLSNSNPEHILELKPGIGQEMLELFLSKELKTVLEYNKMQIELPSNNGLSSKKLKA